MREKSALFESIESPMPRQARRQALQREVADSQRRLGQLLLREGSLFRALPGGPQPTKPADQMARVLAFKIVDLRRELGALER